MRTLLFTLLALAALALSPPGAARATEPDAVGLAEVESGAWTLSFVSSGVRTDVPLLGLGLVDAPTLVDDGGKPLLTWRTADGAHQLQAAAKGEQASFGGWSVALEGGPCAQGVILLPWGQAVVVDGDAARTSPADVLVRREEWVATLPPELGGGRVELVALSTPLSGVVVRWLDGARETSGSCTFERERLRACRLFGPDALVVDLRLDATSDVAGVATGTATRGELSAPASFQRR